MIARRVSLVTAGLVLGLTWVLLGTLALAQKPVPQGDLGIYLNSAVIQVERRLLFEPPVGQVVSHTVRIEPIQLQLAERTTAKVRVPLIVPLLPKPQVTERHHALQRVERESRVSSGQVMDKARSVPLSVSSRAQDNAVARLATGCVVVSPADSGEGTLRQCLEDAVAEYTITFDTDVFPRTSPVTIPLSSALPWIITDRLTVDASDAGVILDGSGLSSGDGFTVVGADNVSIRGLQILRFPRCGVSVMAGATNITIGGDRLTGRGPFGQGNRISGNGRVGVWIQDSGTMSITVLGNYIGTDVSGTSARGNEEIGVVIGFGATNNIIGGRTSGTRNLISGNGRAGVWIQNMGTSGNRVMGNRIGTDVSGTASLGNEEDGVFIGGGATNNIVGGDTSGACNLISGNGEAGVWMQDVGTSGNRVLGNYIGTGISGTTALGNLGDGVFIGFEASNNTVGGDTPGTGNLISGNEGCGIQIQGPVVGNQVLGNYIGTNISGTAALGNASMGVAIIDGATDNTVGGDTPGAGNLISGNGYVGVWIREVGTSGNRVLGNYIGTDASGTASLGNTLLGVVVFGGAKNNIIGGDTSGARNLISGNDSDGVLIQDVGTSGNQILGNHIGTDISGVAPLGNRSGVIILDGATDNIIGGDTPGARNLISGNRDIGIRIESPGTLGNRVHGNYIGTNISGTYPLSNTGDGVFIGFEATNNMVGGDTSGARNIISGNGRTGVRIQDAGTMGNTILGNYIGSDASGAVSLGNAGSGVVISSGATNNIIGGDTPKARNVISGNQEDAGVEIRGNGTMGNVVLGNYIGTNVSGTASLANAEHGVVIYDEATGNIVGGSTSGARNLISGNVEIGIVIWNAGTSDNQVLGNYIGTDVSGTIAIPNHWGVVILDGPTDNTIGGESSSARNLISGNEDAGVRIEGTETSGNRVLGNYIGTDVWGTVSIPNYWGVKILDGSTGNTIGGDRSSARNLISGNEVGVQIQDSGTMSNTVLGNDIGTDDSGTASIPNGFGVLVALGATNNTVGGDTSEARNIISGNEFVGVVIWDAGEGSGNQVLGNYIGTDVSGTAAIPNHWGVYIAGGAMSNVIGSDPNAGNLISGNEEAGVRIEDAGTSNNRVPGNYIRNNAGYGVFIGSGATHNTIGISNTIVYNALDGVVISGTNTLYNTVTRNVIHSNGGLPIELVAFPVPVSPPVVNACSYLDNIVWGTACTRCCVEVFANPTTTPAGTVFVGDVWADASGYFSLTLTDLPPYPYLAATATDVYGTTSEFSEGCLCDRPLFEVCLPLIIKNL